MLLVLSLAQLMVILDISAVNVALPELAHDLPLGGGDIGWTITSYSLVFGSLLLLGGRAADLLGRRRVFLDAGGSYLTDVLPGMLLAGLGLGVVLVAVAVSVLTGASAEDSGMLSGLNTTGHELGGSLGIAVLTTVAATSGIGDAFLVAAAIAGVASLAALVVLPSAASFLPKLKLAPRVAVH